MSERLLAREESQLRFRDEVREAGGERSPAFNEKGILGDGKRSVSGGALLADEPDVFEEAKEATEALEREWPRRSCLEVPTEEASRDKSKSSSSEEL